MICNFHPIFPRNPLALVKQQVGHASTMSSLFFWTFSFRCKKSNLHLISDSRDIYKNIDEHKSFSGGTTELLLWFTSQVSLFLRAQYFSWHLQRYVHPTESEAFGIILWMGSNFLPHESYCLFGMLQILPFAVFIFF